jgi:ribosomal protein S18 acetylase RimI-like enzyme
MSHVLDNMIWNAIATGNKNIAIVNKNAGCYVAEIAPFAAVKECSEKNFEELYELIPPGRWVVVSFGNDTMPNEDKWKLLQRMDCCQMVYEKTVSNFTTKANPLIEPLGMEHVPQMLELTALTKPGPFLEKTILFGNYFGIFQNERLVAMAGQRMNPVPYMEVSAVCTHPDFRGRGYAKALMLHVMKIILDNSFTPFLHVLTSNTTAIALYESIGYRIRKRIFMDSMKRL